MAEQRRRSHEYHIVRKHFTSGAPLKIYGALRSSKRDHHGSERAEKQEWRLTGQLTRIMADYVTRLLRSVQRPTTQLNAKVRPDSARLNKTTTGSHSEVQCRNLLSNPEKFDDRMGVTWMEHLSNSLSQKLKPQISFGTTLPILMKTSLKPDSNCQEEKTRYWYWYQENLLKNPELLVGVISIPHA